MELFSSYNIKHVYLVCNGRTDYPLTLGFCQTGLIRLLLKIFAIQNSFKTKLLKLTRWTKIVKCKLVKCPVDTVKFNNCQNVGLRTLFHSRSCYVNCQNLMIILMAKQRSIFLSQTMKPKLTCVHRFWIWLDGRDDDNNYSCQSSILNSF